MSAVWEHIARYVATTYDTEVNFNEEYFLCPECGEPVYACDYIDSDYFLGKNAYYTHGKVYCPICEQQLNSIDD